MSLWKSVRTMFARSTRRRENPRRPSSSRPSRYRPAVELLEDRTLPSLSLVNSSFFGGPGDQRGTAVSISGGALYVSGNVQPESQQPSDTALVVKYGIAPGPSPLWSRNFGSGSNFRGIAATNEGVYAGGWNYSLTSDPVGGKEVKTLLGKFAPDGSSGPGTGGSVWLAGSGGTSSLGAFFVYSGVEFWNGLTTAVEGGTTYVYAAGFGQPCSFGGSIVAKYDTLGNRLAAATDSSQGLDFNTCFVPSGGGAGASAVTVLNGSIYVAGGANQGGVEGPTIWKHDANLNLIWRQRDASIAAHLLGISSLGGAIYGVGLSYTPGVAGSENYLIQKYDEAGNRLWSTSFGGANTDVLTGVVGIGSRLFAVGYTASQGAGGTDAVVLEINPATGAILSTTLFGGAQDDKANGVATDGTHLYVVGESRSFAQGGNPVGQNDGMLLRYSVGTAPSADFGFAFALGGSADDVRTNVATDGAGSLYVAGAFTGTVDFDPGPGTFNLTSAGHDDMFVAKYSSSGALVWARAVHGPNQQEARAIAVDSAGNVYTTGHLVDTADFDPGPGTFNLTHAGTGDAFVLKLDSGGNFVWAGRVGSTGSDVGQAIAVDATGNVYTAIDFNGPGPYTVDFDPGPGTFNLTGANEEVAVLKLDSAGNFVWARSFGGSGYDRPMGLAVDGAGNVYTSGILFEGASADYDPGPGTHILTGAPLSDGFVSKLDANGNFVWAHLLGGHSTNFGITLDGTANVYVTGAIIGTVDFDPGSGTFNLTSAGDHDAFVWKLTSAGGLVWARAMGGGGRDIGFGITVDAANNVYTTGSFSATADFDPGPGTFNLTSAGVTDIFVTKLDASGAFTWAVRMGGPGGDDFGSSAYPIALDPAGNVYTTAYFSGTADFDPGSGTANLTSAGGTDIFVSKLIQNRPPTANAGGPYTAAEGGSVTLTGSGSDPDGDPLTYAWDLDNNGTFETPGQSVTFSAAGRDGPSSHTVMLRVSDNKGASAASSGTVNITNVAPTLSNVRLVDPVSALIVSSVNEGSPVRLTGTITDPGIPDTFTLTINWGDGTETVSLPAGTTTFARDHTYADDNPSGTASDTYMISLTLSDDDGGFAVQPVANRIDIVPASPTTGPAICKPGFAPPQCTAVPFATAGDLAFQGNGLARATVARDNIPGHDSIHRPEYANDGYYGNGSSWISNSPNSWLKVDLGQTVWIDRLTFGRDRTGNYDDRDPGPFTIAVALADNVYANGDDSNDPAEYLMVFNSSAAGFSGLIQGPQTIQASFTPVQARLVKLTFANLGTAIDEVEIRSQITNPVSATTSITVQNVAPTVNAGGNATVNEGSTFSRTGSFTDPGSGPNETWTAQVNYGDGGGFQALALNSDKTFNLSHVYADNGSYSVTVQVRDDDMAAGTFSTATFQVTVNNVAPVANSDAAVTNEDTAVLINVLANDTDVPADPLVVTGVTSPTANGGTVSNNGNGTVTYTPALNFFGSDTFTYTISDGDGGTASATVTVTVNSINDAPVNTVPAPQSASPNGSLVFSALNGNAISVADVDAGAAAVQATLTASSGTLTLSGTTGLAFTSGDGTADGSMTFTGTLAAINTALDGLRYDPAAGFSGVASVTITSNDQGNSGAGGALTDTDTVPITVSTAATIDLVLTVSANPDPAAVGSNLTYTLTVTNAGSFMATGVTLFDNLPNSVAFVSATASQGTGCTQSGGIVTCGLGGLMPGASAGVTIVVTPTKQGMIVNRASVAANERDSAVGNNMVVSQTRVNPGVPLRLAAEPARMGPSAASETNAGLLTREMVRPLLAEAVARWQAAGVAPEALTALSRLEVEVTDLPEPYLGMASPTILWLDDDAAGQGWFIDPTPAADEEFPATADSLAHGKVDLLTVVTHEVGHLLGFDHDEDDALMAESLAPGVRYSPRSHLAAPAEATPPVEHLLGTATVAPPDRLIALLMSGGTTAFHANLTALNTVMAEWESGRNHGVGNPGGTGSGPPLHGDVFLKAAGPAKTAFDDSVLDSLFGGAGHNRLFANLDAGVQETIFGLELRKIVDDLD